MRGCDHVYCKVKNSYSRGWHCNCLISSISCHVLLIDSDSCHGPKYHMRNQPKQGDSTHRLHLTLPPSSSPPPAPLISHSSLPILLWLGVTTPRGDTFIFGCSSRVGLRRERGQVLLNVGENFMRTFSLLLYPWARPTLCVFLFPLCLLCFVWPAQWLWGTWRELHCLMQGRKVEA